MAEEVKKSASSTSTTSTTTTTTTTPITPPTTTIPTTQSSSPSSSPSLWEALRPPPSSCNDTWATFPVQAMQYGYAISTALKAAPLMAPIVHPLLGGLTIAYLIGSTASRSREAGLKEVHPEMIRKVSRAAGLDNFLTLWIESFTIPGIAVGGLVSGVQRVMLHQSTVTATTSSSSSSSSSSAAETVLKQGKWAPALIGVAALPLLAPLSSILTHQIMEWSIRPAIAHFAAPSAAILAPATQYVAPMPEELLGGMGDGAGSSSNSGFDVNLLAPADLDPLSRARLEWALDGDASSTYPEDVDYTTTTRGGSGGGVRGTTGASSSSRASPSSSMTINGRDTGTSGDSGEAYVAAVVAIRANAANRAARERMTQMK